MTLNKILTFLISIKFIIVVLYQMTHNFSIHLGVSLIQSN